MSYRERAELCFDESPLWMLEGPNGAGKSAVFDAITFALYGLHRGGKQEAAQLINHERDSFTVIFDFLLGETVYRVQRTQNRKKSDVRASILDANGFERSIAEANTQVGFKNWLDETLGLDDRTFTTSVLLQQGKSDALLSADARERHTILSQIVDLSAYEELHKTINDEYRRLKTHAELLDSQLQGIARVDDEEIERLRREAEAARQTQATLSAQLETLAVAREKCQEYARKSADLTRVNRELQGAQQLFDAAAEIQGAHERWSELKLQLPQLKNVVELREKLASGRASQAQAEREAQNWQDKSASASENVEKLHGEITSLNAERESWGDKRDAAREQQLALNTPIYELDNLQDEQQALQVLAAQLQQFAPDLDAQLTAKSAEEAELSLMKNALPFLQNFAEARDGWDEMKAEAKQLKAQIKALESQIADTDDERAPAQESLQKTEAELESAQQAQVEARTLLEQERKHFQLLDEVDNQAECRYCGHELTAQHIEQERAARHQAVTRGEAELRARREDLKVAQNEVQATRKYLQEIEKRREDAQREQRGLELRLESQLREGRATQKTAQTALDHLPPIFRAHFAPDDEIERASDHFNNPYPDKSELQTLGDRVRRYATVERDVKTLQLQTDERRDLRTRHDPLAASVARLESRYPPQRARELRDQYAAAQGQYGLAEARWKDVTAQLREREQAHQTAEHHRQSAERGYHGAQQLAVEWRARGEELNARIENLYENLADDWLSVAHSAGTSDIARLSDEFATLHHAPQRLRDLNAAQQQHGAQLEKQRSLQADLDAMPAAARDDLAAIGASIAAARDERNRLEERVQECDGERQAMEGQRVRRNDLLAEHLSVTGAAHSHKTLADLLGPSRLQRFLLQQAETAIVSNANSVLDKISGGTLQIELRSEDDPTRGGRSGVPKALELLARNTQTGTQPMPVYLLSGSQRFRVAVALALGIGQFAGGGQIGHTQNESGGTRRIESVIIDEGFGSLDAVGRQEIIDELHNLKSVLKKVILVSHQEEFSDRFPTRYRIEIENGTSKARLVDNV